jgi:nickel-type superoxide dismutase maturation protease
LLNAGFPPRRVGIGAVLAGAVLVTVWHLVRRVTVEGSSMAPALEPGDRLVVVPAPRLRPGDIVAVPDPRHPRRLLVKRVLSVDRGRRSVVVVGDNRDHSTDSRAFGPLPRRAVVGRVAYRYAPAARVGRVDGPR